MAKHRTAFWLDISRFISKLLCFGKLGNGRLNATIIINTYNDLQRYSNSAIVIPILTKIQVAVFWIDTALVTFHNII